MLSDNLEFETHLKYEDDLKYEDYLKYEDDLKQEDYLKYEDDLKYEDYLKYEEIVNLTSPKDVFHLRLSFIEGGLLSEVVFKYWLFSPIKSYLLGYIVLFLTPCY